MRKWLVIMSLMLIIITSITIIIYLNAVEPVKAAKDKAVMIVKEETVITDVDEFNIYNGEESFYIIQGRDKKGTKLIAWVPEKKGKTFVKKASDGISKQQALNKVLKEKNPDEIISV